MAEHEVKRKPIAVAAGKALGLWVLFYVVLLHVSVLKSHMSVRKERHIELALVLEKEQDINLRIEVMQKAINVDFEASLSRIDDQRNVLRNAVVEMEDKFGGDVDPNNQDSEEKSLFRRGETEGHEPSDPVELCDLLLRFLRTIITEDLQEKYSSRMALQGVLNRIYMENIQLKRRSDDTMEAWQDLAILFDEEYDKLMTLDFQTMLTTCPQQPSEEDLQQQEQAKKLVDGIVQKMEYYLDTHDWPAVLDETKMRIEDQYQDTIQSGISSARTLIENRGAGEGGREVVVQSGCITSAQQVVPWLDAGIDAVYRNRDIRQAILDAIKDDPSVEGNNIILDADLTDGRKQQPEKPSTRTLRQFLDTPLTKAAAFWIDTIVDLTSGYSDRLDQFLDDLANKKGRHGLLGPAAVQYLLETAGKVNIRVPDFSARK